MPIHMQSADFEVIRGAGEGIPDVLADAARHVPADDRVERGYIDNLQERMRRGDLGIYTLMHRGRAAGAIYYRALDGDAELVFGHALGGEGLFLRAVVEGLFHDGIHTIRSNFNWPEPRNFVSASKDLGFIVTERMSMCRSPAATRSSAKGFDILPWDDAYAAAVCDIMHRNQSPADQPVYPVFSTQKGVRLLMDSVLADRHGKFLRGLSYVAVANGCPIGFILATLLADGSILILDVGVDRPYRKKGVGGALLDRLIDAAYRDHHGQILLAVTYNNYDAIRLYERKGFQVNVYFRQHVLSKLYPTPAAGRPSP